MSSPPGLAIFAPMKVFDRYVVTILLATAVLAYVGWRNERQAARHPDNPSIADAIIATPQQRLIAARADEINDEVVAWRRHLHANPELANREVETAAFIAERLREFGFDDIRTEVAHTGVVGLLRGARGGTTVAIRSDMDGLPVTEVNDLPFKSRRTTIWKDEQVGVMHACGHDVHMAMALGAAKILSEMRDSLRGNVKFIFQPAEEGPPPGENGGSQMMIEEGVLDNPRVSAIFGFHVWTQDEPGAVHVRPSGTMASSSRLYITVRGKQTHGAVPVGGSDPIVAASQIVLGLQNIVSRQISPKQNVVISIGRFIAAGRHNIIPDKVELVGTIRTLDPSAESDVYGRIRKTAETIAAASGAVAEVTIERRATVVYNDSDLVNLMQPTFRWVAGEDNVRIADPVMASEDFSWYQTKVPGIFYFLPANPYGVSAREAARNHSPFFIVNEDVIPLGVKSMAGLAYDYLERHARGELAGIAARTGP